MLNFLKVLFYVVLISKSFGNSSPLSDFFDTSFTSDESDCFNILSSDEFNPSNIKSSHIGQAMKRGFWKCAKDMATLLQGNGVDIRNDIDLESRIIMKEITSIKSAIESAMPSNIITPAFQWAQSPNDLFLNIKFAHKLDAPATLNVEVENVTLTNATLFLQASDGKKTFRFSIET